MQTCWNWQTFTLCYSWFLHVKSTPWLPPGPTRIQNWYHSKFQLILAIFGPLIPKLCSDKSESGGKWILFSHWLRILQMLEISQWESRIHFPPLSDLSENTFGITGLNVASISWNFEWYQLFILVGPGGNRGPTKKSHVLFAVFELDGISFNSMLSICLIKNDWQEVEI